MHCYHEQYVALKYFKSTHSATDLSGFTNNARERGFAECGIENFEFIVSARVQVNPVNSRAKRALTFLLFKLNTLHKKIVKL